MLVTLERLVKLASAGSESVSDDDEQPAKRRKTADGADVEPGSAMDPSWMEPTARLLLNEACRSGSVPRSQC